MSYDWDDVFSDESTMGEDLMGAFYCPYTNGAECALMTKGWQPQELCDTLECDQLKLFRRNHKRSEAA